MQTVRVPDIGSDDAVDVIEVPVKVGDQLDAEATIVVLESDKATVEVPLPEAGKVKQVLVKTGDRVRQGDPLLEIDIAGSSADSAEEPSAGEEPPAKKNSAKADKPAANDNSSTKDDKSAAGKDDAADNRQSSNDVLRVPDLGDISEAEVIELQVKVGDTIEVDQIIAVLESDKASLELPASAAGKLTSLAVQVGDKVKTGDLLGELRSSAGSDTAQKPGKDAKQDKSASTEQPREKPANQSDQRASTNNESRRSPSDSDRQPDQSSVNQSSSPSSAVHAGPAVRKLARELGIDLARVPGSGPRQRIVQEDVHAWVKKELSRPAAASGAVELPEIDFSRFGEVEKQQQSKLRRVAATNLHRSWQTIPHVTQHDLADITGLEEFRRGENTRLAKDNIKLTPLAFLVRACAVALEQFPRFNSSLSVDGETLILKRYIHIGVAVETDNGLMVPVLRDANRKGVIQIAREVAELANKARQRKLTLADMQGGSFSISSLGGIGGTAFTPIVNWPEVAILGVSKSDWQPHWNGEIFEPRLMLPLSLSYDHRVIDGADAARFITYLSNLLGDMRRALL